MLLYSRQLVGGSQLCFCFLILENVFSKLVSQRDSLVVLLLHDWCQLFPSSASSPLFKAQRDEFVWVPYLS